MAQQPGNASRRQLPFWRQLRWNLIFYFVLLAVLPVLIVAAVTLARTSAQARDQVYNQLDSVVELKHAQLDRWLGEARNALDLVLKGDNRERRFAILIANPATTDSQSLNTILREAVTTGTLYTRLFVYDQSGLVIAASNAADIGKIVDRQPYFERSLQGAGVTPPFFGLSTGALEVYYGRPIADDSGRIVGALVGQLDTNSLADITYQLTGLGETGDVYLISLENSYLLTPSRFEGYPTNRAYSSQGIDSALSGEAGRGAYLDYRNPAVPVFGSYTYLPELELALIAEIDQSEALIATRQVQTVGIALAAVAALAAAGVGLLTAQQISRPISSLTESAARIASGEIGERAVVQATNEVGVLADAFNTMTGQLEDLIDSLEDRVQDRTKDMATTIEVGQLASSLASAEDLLPKIVNFIGERFGLYYTQIYLVDEARRYATLRAGTGDVGEQLTSLGHRLDLSGTSIVSTAVGNRQPVLVEDTAVSEIHLPNPLLPDTRSELAVPLIVGDEVLGVLDMQALEAGTFNPDNRPVFEAMAGQLAATMLGAQAFEEAREAVARAEAINRRLTAESWESYLGRASRGGRVAYLYDLETPRPILGDDALDASLLGEMSDQYLEQAIALRGAQIGKILVGEDRLREWRPEERTLLEGVAEQVAQVADRYRTLDELAEREQRLTGFSRRLQRLQQITQGLAAELRATEDTYAKALAQMSELVSARRAVLQLLDDTESTLRLIGHNASHEMLDALRGMPSQDGLIATVIGDKTSIRMNAMRSDERGRALAEKLPGSTSILAVPVLAEARTIATVLFLDHEGSGFAEDDEALASSFAAVLARTLQASTLFEQVQTTAQELQTIAEVSAAAGATLDIEELLNKVTNLTKERMDLYHVQIYLYEDERQRLTLAAGSGEAGQAMVKREHSISTNSPRSIVARAAQRVEAVVTNNVHDSDFHLPNPLLPDTRSELAVPMIVSGQLIGVLDVQADTPNRFTDDEVRIMSTFAGQIGAAAQNARLYTEQIRSQRRQELAFEVAQQLSSLLDPDVLVQETVNSVAEAFAYYHAHIYLLNDEGDRLVVRAGLGDAGALMKEAGHSIALAAERSLVAGAARGGHPVVENDVAGSEGHLPNPLLPDTRSEAAVPLKVGQQVLGVLDVQHNIVNHFTTDEVQTLNIVASQLAVALQNAELFGQTQLALTQTRDLYQTSRSLITSSELEQILNTFARPVLEDGPCWVALMYPIDDGKGEITAFEVVGQIEADDVGGAPNGTLYPVDAFPALRHLLENPEDMVHIMDVSESELMDGDSLKLLAQMNIRATTLIPLVTAQEGWTGLLSLAWSRPYDLSDRVRQLYGVLIPQMTSLVDNRRLFDRAVQTAEQLREVDRLKNEFLANMSHELRTPLNSIIGYSELLIDDLGETLDEMSVEDLKAIHSSGHHLLAIINDILDLAKIEAGRLQLNLEEITLDDLIPQVVEMSRVLLKDKPNVELQLHLEEGLPSINADTVRLRQIVWNLLSNAIKFTEKGHVRVTTWKDEESVYLSVEDTGIGIPAQYHATIFDQFRQVDGSATRKAGGTGLGLTISRELIHLHGGDMWVESQVGKGSTFSASIPHNAPVKARAKTGSNGSKRRSSRKEKASGD